MKAAIYNTKTGVIRGIAYSDFIDSLLLEPKEGEEFYLNCPDGATHIINNEPITVAPPPLAAEELLARIRSERNTILSACDWTQIPDAPLTPEKKAAWTVYRQTLRDFAETCDPANPAWPVSPI